MLLDLRSLLEVASGAYSYSGSGGIVFGGAAQTRFEAQVDSRGWRYHAHAPAHAPARARTRVRVLSATSDAVAVVVASSRMHARIGSVSAGAGSAAVATSAAIRSRARAGEALGGVVATLPAAHVGARVLEATATGSVVSFATRVGAHAHARTGTVEIGPNLVEQELEEILFLLEVA